MEKDRGFNFVEVIASLAIILILTAVTGFSAFKYISKARVASCRTQMDSFKMALQAYYMDCGRFPTREQGLSALWEKPVLSPVPAGWNGPYVDAKNTTDPWGTEYNYQVPGENNLPYGIVSYGADGQKEGDGENADIVSWER